MTKSPVVSVVLSTYREPVVYVESALRSIQAQTHDSFEIIVVIDDPTNESVVTYLSQTAMSDSRVRVIIHDTPQGLAVCRNDGIEASQGRYIALMDADDIALPERLVTQQVYLETHALDAVFSHVTYINETDEAIGSFTPVTHNPARDIFKRHLFAHPTGFLKRAVFDVERYDPDFMRAQDVDLWLRLLRQKVAFGIVSTTLLRYRIHRQAEPEARIKRQAAYAQYGFKIVCKHFRQYWSTAVFWRFATKWTFYYVVLNYTPRSILVALVTLRDQVRR